MKFQINNAEWTIKEVTEAEMNNEMKDDNILGATIYKTQEILLLKDQSNIVKTLKHELTHAWLYEYGHNQDNEKTFGCEDICEIVASSNDFISDTVEKYLGIKKLYVCDTTRNKTCKKNNCYINGGECASTTDIKYAKRFNNERNNCNKQNN